jgi:Ser-tRNA(Ala) deacylase AlaX
MKTIPVYLKDSYAKTMEAEVLEVYEAGDNRWRLILDKTVFYPMGGGQPTDQGKLVGDSWEGEVFQVLNKDGEIQHYVDAQSTPTKGMKVKGEIDWNRRFRNMRIHSAGHLIDFAMHLLGYSPEPLMPCKGDHGKKAFITYQGTLNKNIKDELEKKSNELIKKNLKITWKQTTFEELKKDAIYIQPYLPTNKPLRKITLESVGSVADGGTLVKETNEVREIEIFSVETIDDNTKVRYRVK